MGISWMFYSIGPGPVWWHWPEMDLKELNNLSRLTPTSSIKFELIKSSSFQINELKLETGYYWWSVWPDAGIKSSPNFPQSCPNCSNESLYWLMMLFKVAQMVAQILWLLLPRKFVSKSFEKSPIWSHCWWPAHFLILDRWPIPIGQGMDA